MKLIEKIAIAAGIFLLIFGSIAYLYIENQRLTKDNDRLTQNNQELMGTINEKNGTILNLQLKPDELDKLYGSKIDSIGKANNIKIKRIQSLSHTKIRYKKDTILKWQSVFIPGDTIVKEKKLIFQDSCFKFEVISPAGSDSAIVKSDINFETYIIINKGKRKKEAKLFGLTLFRFGERITESKGFINCKSAQYEITNIKVIE